MSANLQFFGGVNEIGGNKIFINDNGTKIFLDFGRAMGRAGKYYEEFIQVRSKSALLDLLKLGILPKLDGIYPEHLLDITAMPRNDLVELESKLPFEDAEDYWKNDSIIPYCDKNKIDAVFISHAHFDHIQDISFIHKDIKIHCTETTKVLAKAITDISKSSVENQFYEINDKKKLSVKSESPKTVFPGEIEYKDYPENDLIHDKKTGYTFTYEVKTIERNYNTDTEGKIKTVHYRLIPVGHSIPGACSVLLTTKENKRILYTGDIRFHGQNEPTFDDYIENIGDKKIDILICEGTRIDSDIKLTEENVYEDILAETKKTKGLLLVDFGWKDTTRFETILKVAAETGRTLVINTKIAYLLYELHRLDGKRYSDPRKIENVKVYKKRQGNLLYSKVDYETFKAGYLCHWGRNKSKNDLNIARICEKMGIGGESCTDLEKPTEDEIKTWNLAVSHIENGIPSYEIRKNPEKYILMFSFWDANELFDLSSPEGKIPYSKYIRASCEPFNDEMEIDEEKLMNWLDKFGVDYDITNKDGKKFFKRAHVSGHVSRNEISEIIRKIKPRKVIPIHTQYPDEFVKIVDRIEEGVKVIIPRVGEIYDL
jgi:ribonuclease J